MKKRELKEQLDRLQERVDALEAVRKGPIVNRNTLLDYILRPDTKPDLPYTDARAKWIVCPGCSPGDFAQPHICGIGGSWGGDAFPTRTIITGDTHWTAAS